MASSATAPSRSSAPIESSRIPSRVFPPWWLQPLAIVLVLSAFGIYSFLMAVFGYGAHYVEPYLSPFYSPPIPLNIAGISPAIYILWIPLLFRATCYYYRKSYYRSFFWDPPACAINEVRRGGYRGETGFPWMFNNLHRFFLYLAIVVLAFLWWDTVEAFNLHGRFMIGLGSLIFLANVIFLSLYTLSCHSLRHLLGGNVDCYSCTAGGNVRHGVWSALSVLNKRHGLYAWLSLFSVAIADLYVRLLAAGVLVDPRVVF
jgi:hypothetical protein